MLGVTWEVTRACALSCRSCRAMPKPCADPRELTTEEGKRLIGLLVELGSPLLVLAGGDPFERPDLDELTAYAIAAGLRLGLAASATPLATRERLARLRDIGLSLVQLSLDGLDTTHDRFRGVPGSYQRTLEIIRDVRGLGIPLEVGTIVTRRTVGDLPELAERLRDLDVQVWDLFFPVPTLLGLRADLLGPLQTEVVLEWLWELSARAPFRIRTTAAPHIRRVAIQHERLARGLPADPPADLVGGQAADGHHPLRLDGAAGPEVADGGEGFLFVSHVGDVCPSGLLQTPLGNVREHSIAEIQRDQFLFRVLREPERLGGKCGRCEYRAVCGGSRARAWALTGNPLAPDPVCAYVPGAGVPPLPSRAAVFAAPSG